MGLVRATENERIPSIPPLATASLGLKVTVASAAIARLESTLVCVFMVVGGCTHSTVPPISQRTRVVVGCLIIPPVVFPVLPPPAFKRGDALSTRGDALSTGFTGGAMSTGFMGHALFLMLRFVLAASPLIFVSFKNMSACAAYARPWRPAEPAPARRPRTATVTMKKKIELRI